MYLKYLLLLFVLLLPIKSFANTEAEEAYQAGMHAYNNEEYQNAVYAFEHSISYDPALYKSYCMLGLSYIFNNETEKGLYTYLKAIKKFPDEWNAYILIAEFYEAQGKSDEALAYYLKAENLLPPNKQKKYQSKIQKLREIQKNSWIVSETERENILSNILSPFSKNDWVASVVEKKEAGIHIIYSLKKENYQKNNWSKILDLTCTYTKKQTESYFNKLNENIALHYRKNNGIMNTIEKTKTSRLYETVLHKNNTNIIGYIFPVNQGFCISQFMYKKLNDEEKTEVTDYIKKIVVKNF